MKKRIITSFLASFFVIMLVVTVAFAEDVATTDEFVPTMISETSAALENREATVEEAGEEDGELEGMEVAEPKSVPSGFGLFLREWRERISLALTFDPVKKAGKQLLYAEEKMKLAEKILAESTHERAQEKAQKMIEQAQKHIVQIEEKKAKWEEKTGEKVERLKNNLATHQLRRDKVMERIGERVPEEAKEKFNDLREKLLEGSSRLLNVIEKDKIPEDLKEHLQDVRERIEKHGEVLREYRLDRKEVLNSGISEEEIRIKLRELNQERKQQLEDVRIEYRQRMEEFRNNENKEGEEVDSEESDSALLRARRRALELQKQLQERAEEVEREIE